MNALQRLWDHGQSVWLDNLSRKMLRDGELAGRVAEEGVRGVTSNPSIFHDAITKGDDYDEDIARRTAAGAGVRDVYEALAVADVRAACDILRAVWDESDGLDGYVSLEVDPHLAHDTDRTLVEARRLSHAVSRDNLLIKIPGTPAGVPAIREAIFEGISINVTLLFSIEAYEAVAEAYVEALERRLEAGRRLDRVISVASFFLSRIDTLTDQRLEALRGEVDDREIDSLLGQAAVANAKIAYARFDERIAGERWRRLAARGARPQRLLWASTSTKNPAYPDTKYVDPLIGDLTINTMPESTIQAFLAHGTVADTVRDGRDEAQDVVRRLEAAGIDFAGVTGDLLDEGVAKFVAPFDALLSTLGERMSALAASSAS